MKFLPTTNRFYLFSNREEVGFLGASLVLLLYYLLIFKIISISKNITEDYGRYILYGISGIFLAHIIVNVGMTVGLVPVYRKTSIINELWWIFISSLSLSSFIMIGLILNIKINDGKKDE